MRNLLIGVSAVALASVSAPAFAQDGPPAAVTVSGSVTVVTDYRFRGISQTDKDFAVQAGATIAHESGLYAAIWGSSIDDYVTAGGSDQEIDLSAGYSHSFGGTTVDVGALYYFYPGNGGFNSDFIEPYASVKQDFGPAALKATMNWAPKQGPIGAANLYGALDLTGSIPNTPVSLSAHLGHNFSVASALAFGKRYTDWSIGASVPWKSVTFGVTYVDTNFPTNWVFVKGHDIAQAGVFGSVSFSF